MTLGGRLARAFLESHPSEAARALERMPIEQRVAVVRAAPAAAANALRYMTAAAAVDSLIRLTPDEAAPVLERLPLQTVTGLLRRLSADTADHLLGGLHADRQDALRRGLRFPSGTAGALMDPAVFAVPDDVTITEARLRLRREGAGSLHYVYAVDRDGVLKGWMDTSQVMHAPARALIRDVLHDDADPLPAWTPAAAVKTHAGWRRVHEIPVTDEHQRLMGVIRYATWRRLVDEQDTARDDRITTATVGALGELFHLGVAGIIEGVAAAAAPREERASGSTPPAEAR